MLSHPYNISEMPLLQMKKERLRNSAMSGDVSIRTQTYR